MFNYNLNCKQTFVLILIFIMSLQESSEGSNWLKGLFQQRKDGVHPFQAIVMFDGKTENHQLSKIANTIVQEVNNEISSIVINFLEEDPQQFRSSVASRSVHESTLFITIQVEKTNPKIPLEFLMEVSGSSSHPRCLMIILLDEKSVNREELLRFAWSKNFLDLTILEVLMETDSNRNQIWDHQQVFAVIHDFNPFNQSYSRRRYLKGNPIFWYKLHDLKRYEIKTASFDYPPLLSVKRNLSGHVLEVSGPNANLFKIISKVLNFRISNVPQTNNFMGNSRCVKSKSSGLMKKLVHNEVQLLHNELALVSVCKEYSFTIAFSDRRRHFTPLVSILKSTKMELSATKSSFYMGLLTCFLVALIWLILVLLKFDNQFWCLLNLVQMLLGFPVPRDVKKVSDRIALLFILFGFWLFSNTFYSILMDVKLEEKTEEKLNTLVDLNTSNIQLLMSDGLKNILLKNENYEILQSLLKNSGNYSTTDECIQLLIKWKNVSCIMAEPIMKMELQKHIDESVTPAMKILRESLFEAPEAILLESNSPYVFELEKTLLKIAQSGLVVKWNQEFIPEVIGRSSSELEFKEDSAGLIVNLLLILFSGYSISIVAFLGEVGRGEKDDSSDGIEFERDEGSNSIEFVGNSNEAKAECEQQNGDLFPKVIQFMYIQMEFCEKSTLRTAIDNGLYEDEDRAWRLFREIGEGLAHIHRQGMIHRDLKPVNIFIDSNDHVKIGDFGLATTNIFSSLTQSAEANRESVVEKVTNDDQEDLGSLTGEVGTAAYVAPELNMKTAKAIYNQKVDIYSLGIIFFEMVYKPPETGMERVQILFNIRSKDIILPNDLLEADMPNQIHLLKWLLNHDPSLRPTAQELLNSNYLPPPQVEEAEFQDMICHTLSNKESKAYRKVLDTWFTQEFTPAEGITFDMNLTIKGVVTSLLPRIQFYLESIKSKVVKVFQKHGGNYVATPLFLPNSAHMQVYTQYHVKVVTRSGSVVSLPYDLRIPFVRYVIWNNIHYMRRYAIERVFRETKVYGFHPRELLECAFDVITPTSKTLMEEAEMLSIVFEIINEISELRERSFTVRLNHTSLLQAVLMYCGIPSEKYKDIYAILCDARNGKISQFQVQTHLISLCLTDQAMVTLFNLLETESSVEKIVGILKTLTKRKGEAAALAREGLREVETVISYAEALGVKWPITVVPLLVHNIEQHSGIFFQVITRESKRRRKGGPDVIAAGGRYDKLLESVRQVLKCTPMASKELKQSGVGISISLDKLIFLADEMGDDNHSGNKLAIVVCCVGEMPKRNEEMAEVLRELYALDFRVTSLSLPTAEEIMDYCLRNAIDHVVMLRTGEQGFLRVQTWDKDRFQEKKICTLELTEYLQKQVEFVSPSLNRSESKTNTGNELSTSIPSNVNVNFVLSEKDKMSGSGRRSYKNSMLTQMSSHLLKISHKTHVEVFAVFLEMAVMRNIINLVDVDEEENAFQKSIQTLTDMFPRNKEYLEQICEEIRDVRNEKNHPVIILYSLSDRRFMTLV